MEGPSDGSVTQPEFRRVAWYLEPNPSLGTIYSVSFTGLQNFPKSSECWAPLAVWGAGKPFGCPLVLSKGLTALHLFTLKGVY